MARRTMEDEEFVDRFKDAMSYRAAGVTIVALREDARIHATTVSSFMSVSIDPPTVLISVTGNAQVLPFLEDGAAFTVSLLGSHQRRLASVYADSFPVGPSPFPDAGPPVIDDALASLVCDVVETIDLSGGRLVLGRVSELFVPGGERALVHFRRQYFPVP